LFIKEFHKTRQLTTHEQDRQDWLSTYSGPIKKKTAVATYMRTVTEFCCDVDSSEVVQTMDGEE